MKQSVFCFFPPGFRLTRYPLFSSALLRRRRELDGWRTHPDSIDPPGRHSGRFQFQVLALHWKRACRKKEKKKNVRQICYHYTSPHLSVGFGAAQTEGTPWQRVARSHNWPLEFWSLNVFLCVAADKAFRSPLSKSIKLFFFFFPRDAAKCGARDTNILPVLWS